jgi:hypothetical protein
LPLPLNSKENKSHALLQVAGGQSNIPAVKLYQKFEFVDGKEEFNSPNDNLLVKSFSHTLSPLVLLTFLGVVGHTTCTESLKLGSLAICEQGKNFQHPAPLRRGDTPFCSLNNAST